MTVKTKCVYDDPELADGYRVLVMRYWPRGIRKNKIDSWEKELGSPPELIREWKNGSISWSKFSREYLKAMKSQENKIAGLASLAKRRNITLLCGCRDDDHCHRKLLKKLIEEQKLKQ